MSLNYSIIIPVYNRPQEIEELLHSLVNQTYAKSFEIVIIEDGSTNTCDLITEKFKNKLSITYLFKENTGAGQSRNEGMKIAKGNYFIILDSDVILPKNYLVEIDDALNKNYTDTFGSQDKAHKSFTAIQKAINYAMTSFLTTGGLRNNKGTNSKFQLRSFNMGISKKAFLKTNGFSNQNFGEDIDLSYKIWNAGFESQFIKTAFVYHKRRSDFKQFYKQTFNFGSARPILNRQHKSSAKLTYWFPSLFVLGLFIAVLFSFFGFHYFSYFYLCYFILILITSLMLIKSIKGCFLSVIATPVQFFGYGFGFMRSQFRLRILNKNIKDTFPKMFN